jgi:hypothetical protein
LWLPLPVSGLHAKSIVRQASRTVIAHTNLQRHIMSGRTMTNGLLGGDDRGTADRPPN